MSMKFPKFKLPPNSLFAVLLRSRWWISILIGAVLSALALAALPAPYGPVSYTHLTLPTTPYV